MEPKAKKDVMDALQGAYAAIKGRQHANLHGLSNHTLHTMSIYQEEDVAAVAIAIYSLDKIFETEKFQKHRKIKDFTKAALSHIDDAIYALRRDDFEKYSQMMAVLLRDTDGFSKRIRFYISDLLEYAKINKGSKLYEHGLSLGRAAETLGVSKWDLMPATGETTTHEHYVEPIAEDAKRIGLIEKMFKSGGSTAIYFDSSTLISLATTCGLTFLPQLHNSYAKDFAITNTVYGETIGRAMASLRFKYEGLRLGNLLKQNVLTLRDEEKFSSEISSFMDAINKIFYVKGNALKIVHPGEISVLVAGKKLGCDALAIDERTTRLVIENPGLLKELLGEKMHTTIKVDKSNLKLVSEYCEGLPVMRSTEFAVSAWGSGLLGDKSRDALEGILWALKFAGCAISGQEINTYLNKLT